MTTRQVHKPCRKCGRLLVPVNGLMPIHKRPVKARGYSRKCWPLTGADAPWCEGGIK